MVTGNGKTYVFRMGPATTSRCPPHNSHEVNLIQNCFCSYLLEWCVWIIIISRYSCEWY